MAANAVFTIGVVSHPGILANRRWPAVRPVLSKFLENTVGRDDASSGVMSHDDASSWHQHTGLHITI
jgi:hypothetical protein